MERLGTASTGTRSQPARGARTSSNTSKLAEKEVVSHEVADLAFYPSKRYRTIIDQLLLLFAPSTVCFEIITFSTSFYTERCEFYSASALSGSSLTLFFCTELTLDFLLCMAFPLNSTPGTQASAEDNSWSNDSMANQEAHAFFPINQHSALENVYLYHRNAILDQYRSFASKGSDYMPFSEYKQHLASQNRELVDGELELIKRLWKFLHVNHLINPHLQSQDSFGDDSMRHSDAVFPNPSDSALQLVPRVAASASSSDVLKSKINSSNDSKAPIAQARIEAMDLVVLSSLASLSSSPQPLTRPSHDSDLSASSDSSSTSGTTLPSSLSASQASNPLGTLHPSLPSGGSAYSALEALAAAFESPLPLASNSSTSTRTQSHSDLDSFTALVSNASSLLPSDDLALSSGSTRSSRRKRNWSSVNTTSIDARDALEDDDFGDSDRNALMPLTPPSKGSTRTRQSYIDDSDEEALSRRAKKLENRRKKFGDNMTPTQRTLRSDPRSPEKLLAPLTKFTKTMTADGEVRLAEAPRLLAETEAEHAAAAVSAFYEAQEKADQRKRDYDMRNGSKVGVESKKNGGRAKKTKSPPLSLNERHLLAHLAIELLTSPIYPLRSLMTISVSPTLAPPLAWLKKSFWFITVFMVVV